jgi:hypothetical protein
VKDLDVVLLFAALPGERFPEFPRLVKHVDFDPSSLGRQASNLEAIWSTATWLGCHDSAAGHGRGGT